MTDWLNRITINSDLEKEDIHAALKYASRKLDHPVIAA
jgi:uncharacterized protein (DUF433 family)